MGYELIKRSISLLTPQKVKNYIVANELSKAGNDNEYARMSYSQEGEDLVLERIIGDKGNGFYIDIGAHHPKRFSNTYFFYKKGWKGINIDPMPGIMKMFDKERPLDTNLEFGISQQEREITYYMFNEPALNTFVKGEAKRNDGLKDYKIIEEKKIKTYPLKSILKSHLDCKTNIDFMTIDVEGLDFEVLRSNDWEKYRPAFLLIEDLKKQTLKEFLEYSEMHKYLGNLGYSLIAKTCNTFFFKDKNY